MSRRQLPPDDDALDVVDLVIDPDYGRGIEAVTPAPASDAHSSRPAVASGISVRTATAAAMACAAAVVVTVMVAQYRHRTITTERHQDAPVAVAVDALGCPVRSQCTITGLPQLGMMSAVQLWNPRVEVDAGDVILDDTSTPVRSTLELDLPASQDDGELPAPVWISVVSQCVPGGAPVRASTRRQRTIVEILVPGGRAGCSVAVTAASEAALEPLVVSLTQLARRSALQL